MKTKFFQLYYYVPKSHLKVTKQAIFAAGAGCIQNYSCCSFETKGTGQFKPEVGSDPYIGKIGKITRTLEYKVETICPANRIKKVIAALKSAHPYEQPAYGILPLKN